MAEALEFWRRSHLEKELREGYLATAKEDRATADRHMAAAWELTKWPPARLATERYRLVLKQYLQRRRKPARAPRSP